MPLVYSIPGWAGLLLITLLCIALACAGHIVVHRAFPKHDFIEHNEVAGFTLSVIGVLYAVLLGFITVVVWEHFSQSDERAQAEVDAATDVWRLGELLPPPTSIRIREDVDHYALTVGGDEWPKMRVGRSSAAVQKVLVDLFGDTARIPLGNRPELSNLQNHLLDRVQVLADLRRHRVADIGSTVPPIIKMGLVLGAIIIVAFLYLFGMKNFRVQLLITATMAATIGILLGLIVLLDYPFRGDVSVSPERWFALHDAIAAER